MKNYIIDASVIVSMLLHKDENILEVIEKIFIETEKGKARIWAPELLHYEVSNALRFSVKEKALTQEFFDTYLQFPIKYFSLNDIHLREAINYSYIQNTTVYDTSYHFLALLLNGTLYTRDKKYYKNAKGLGLIKLI